MVRKDLYILPDIALPLGSLHPYQNSQPDPLPRPMETQEEHNPTARKRAQVSQSHTSSSSSWVYLIAKFLRKFPVLIEGEEPCLSREHNCSYRIEELLSLSSVLACTQHSGCLVRKAIPCSCILALLPLLLLASGEKYLSMKELTHCSAARRSRITPQLFCDQISRALCTTPYILSSP